MSDYYERHKKEIQAAAALRKNEATIEKAREDWFTEQNKEVSQKKTTEVPLAEKQTKDGLKDKRYGPFWDPLKKILKEGDVINKGLKKGQGK